MAQYIFNYHLIEVEKVAKAKKLGKLYDELNNLVKAYSVEDIEFIWSVIKEDLK